MENMNLKPVKNIDEWARKQFTRNRFIYYKRKGAYAECFCSECGEKYVLRAVPSEDPYTAAALQDTEKPERDKETVCRKCNAKAVYKPAGHTKNEYSYNRVCFGQSIDNEHFVFRIFYSMQKTAVNLPTLYDCTEEERIYLEKGKKPTRFEFYCGEWHKRYAGECWGYIVHPKTYKEIKKCGMIKYVPYKIPEQGRYGYDLMEYYITAARYPDFEMIVKMGLTKYADYLIRGVSVNPNPRGKTIQDRLRINKNRLKDLVAQEGEGKALRLYQLERILKAHWTEEETRILEELRDSTWTNDWQKIKTVLKYTSPIRVRNYMIKQKMWLIKETGQWQEQQRRQDLRREYFDYIYMREEQGYDMTSDIILFPADFVRRRDEMILQAEKQKMDERKKKVNAKYPKIEEKYKRLSEKYSAAAAGYIIRPAKNAAEIVEEGRILHHCVGGDNYLQSHNTGYSFILFLRKADQKDMPFITVEIRGTKIFQWYGAYDKKPEEAFFNAWLDTYTKELAERQKGKKNERDNNEQLSTVQASA